MEERIKKVIIPPENLLAVNVSNDVNSTVSSYLVRYRIVSEDKARKSAWSPIYNVFARTVTDILEQAGQSPSYKTSIQGSKIELSWQVPSILKFSKYDVYVQWQNASNEAISTSGSTDFYPYVDTSSTKTLDIPIPTDLTETPTFFKVWIQIETSPKNRSLAAQLLETTNLPLELRITGGSIA
jgi:hypothetical protein